MANAPIPVSCDGSVQGSFFGKLDASASCPRILHRRHRDNVIIEQIRDHHVPSIRESATPGSAAGGCARPDHPILRSCVAPTLNTNRFAEIADVGLRLIETLSGANRTTAITSSGCERKAAIYQVRANRRP
jgi:hypothetical protein